MSNITKNFCDMSGNFFKNKPIWYLGEVDLAAIIIIGFALILAVTSVWNDAPIVDEIPHIGAGYSYVTKGDHRLNPEHPPLAKDLAGLSMKIYGTRDEAAFESRFWKEDINGQWEFGRKLLFGSGNDAEKLVRVAKIPELMFFILSAILIFMWSRKIYGYLAALLSIFLFAFSPTVLAHSRFVTTDMPALFGVLLGTYFFLHYLEKPTNKHLIFAGIALGVAELTKFSVFLLIPFFIVIGIIHGILNSHRFKEFFNKAAKNLWSTLVIVFIGYVFIVWPIYYFHVWKYPPELQHFHTEELLSTYGRRWIADTVVYFSDKPVIRGLAEYGLGLLMVTQRSVGGNTTYFMGEVRNWAWKEYFPIVYFIKEPLAFWGLVLIVLSWLATKLRFRYLKPKNIMDWSRNHFTELTMLLWLTLYWYASITSNLNIGVRHLMPNYGFTFILISGGLVSIFKSINSSKKIFTVYLSLVIILFGWYFYENLKIYPYYLTYFNQIVGGPPKGHLYVVDSNLDWGQDLKRFSDWVDENKIEKVYFDYFGWADQNYYLGDKIIWIRGGKYLNHLEFLSDNPQGGYIAVSASFFMGSREHEWTSYAWLDSYEPIAVIGNSIFIWHITP